MLPKLAFKDHSFNVGLKQEPKLYELVAFS